MGVGDYGRAVVEYGGRRLVVPAATEEQLTGGILKVVRGRARQVGYLVGHGERAPGGTRESYGRLTTALEAENYALDPVDLEDSEVPAATDVLVVAGPQRDLTPPAVARLDGYLRAGGSVLLLLDPVSLPNLSALLATFGVALGPQGARREHGRVVKT
jgi:ABC-type uncharacterized transport system involved in gliding motility auxiliary subunit